MKFWEPLVYSKSTPQPFGGLLTGQGVLELGRASIFEAFEMQQPHWEGRDIINKYERKGWEAGIG